MYQIKKFLDCYIPVTTCNLQCSYCYVAQKGLFKAQIPQFEHNAKEIRQALSKKRLGGTCLINLCAGGETLFASETIEIIRELLEEGHFVMVVTNGLLTKRFVQIASFPLKLLKHLFFKFSFHYLELKRLDAFDTYFGNIERIKNAGCSFTVELTPCDEEIPFIEDIKRICNERLGGFCHVTIARSDIDPEHKIPHLSNKSFEEYIKTWEVFDSKLFDFKKEIFYQHRDEFCYAGEWSAYIHLGNGNMTQCYCGKKLGNVFENIEKPLYFEAVGCACTQAHCYNGHVFLALGNIPEIKAPTYAELRNRKCADGTEWLQPEMKKMMESKLYETNKEYSFFRKKNMLLRQKAIILNRRVKGKMRRLVQVLQIKMRF